MKTTIEISNYPLNADYIPSIKDFIDRLNLNKNIKVKTNATSTHIVGEFDEVMSILQNEIKTSFEKYGKMIFVMKVLNG
ncbi:MAG: thiamine-binding protein, partial [Flavobacteriales bacterium]|nr:thiamine-binding protein [Flavobacteriales bacterium]